MILVDTSVWVEHLRRSQPRLVGLLEEGWVLGHPFVVGELALGSLGNRAEVLELLSDLPRTVVATDDEALQLVEREALRGRGIGWVDTHLLAAARLSRCRLWTRDARLARVARGLDLDA